jgi:hypothetical protein
MAARDVLGAREMALGPLLRLTHVDEDDAVAEVLLHLGGVDFLDVVLDLLDELGAGRAHANNHLNVGRVYASESIARTRRVTGRSPRA